jgi:pyruvate dehydrogenase E2 component (dihydrolipoamide acetyltransferase)
MAEFVMPSLGADMDAGTLTEWLKHPGDAIKRGDVIAVVETQKGAIEIEAFEEGVLDRPLVELGTKVPVGTPLAFIRAAGAPAPRPVASEIKVTEAPAAKPVAPPIAVTVAPLPNGRRVSPAARRIAAERGLSLEGLKGTGPGGAVISTDLPQAVLAAEPPAPKRPGIDLGEMRKAIAAAMARSKREIPHYYLSHPIDLTTAQQWLGGVNAGREPPERILLAALLSKAVALALHAFPEMNGFYQDGAFRPSKPIHLGTAIAIRGGGLVAPAIRDADTLTLDGLMAALRGLVARTRTGRLRSSELFDPTITVSSLGERGVERLYGVIYPPQVAIVGFGTPAPLPRVVDGKVEPRLMVTATLAADHRVSDGHRGALFLLEIERQLQQPDKL